MAKKRTKTGTGKKAAAKAERRNEILVAARDVFARKGYHQATIDDIVKAAGVARGTYYLYFEDKRAVFVDLVDRFAARLAMAISRIDIGPEGKGIGEGVKDNIRGLLTVALAERSMTKILFTDAIGLDPAFDRKLSSFYDELVKRLTESLHMGQVMGIVADGEPRVMAYMTIGALKELLYQMVTLGLAAESADAMTEHVFSFISDGFLHVDGPPEPDKPNPAAKSAPKAAKTAKKKKTRRR